MLLLMALGMLVGFGAAALISIRLGEKRKPEAEQVLGNATVLLLVAAVVSTLVGLATLDPLLNLFGAYAAILPYARDYMRIIVLGSVFQIVGFGLNAMIRGEGNPKIAMLTMLISVLLNIVLAPIFLFVFRWGMTGAALATVSAQAVSAVWVLAYFLGGNSLLRLRARNLRLRWSVCGRLLAIGSAPCAMQIANSAVHSVINHQLHSYEGNLAIWGIIFPMFMLIFMPVVGINQGAQPIIGYNYGSLRFDRVKKTLQTAVLAASGIAVLGFVVMMVFPAHVFWLFSRGPGVDRGGRSCHASVRGDVPLVGFQIVSAGYFQAVGKPAQAMFLTLSRQVLLLIPAVLILPHFFGLRRRLDVAAGGRFRLVGLDGPMAAAGIAASSTPPRRDRRPRFRVRRGVGNLGPADVHLATIAVSSTIRAFPSLVSCYFGRIRMKTLLTEEQLRQGLDRLANEIRQHYQGRPLTIVGVLIGSVVFLVDLIRRLDNPLRVELIQARNHRHGSTRPGPLVIDMDLLSSDVRGQDVLLVDDIFHTGNTFWELLPQIDELHPASVRTAVLLRKSGQSQVPIKPDFVGFDIPDAFVVGYGMDYRDKYRNLPYLATLEPGELKEEPGR